MLLCVLPVPGLLGALPQSHLLQVFFNGDVTREWKPLESRWRSCHMCGKAAAATQAVHAAGQGCQMACFQTKNPNLGKFWRGLYWKMLIYFMPI
jgi:hypothetical protein